MPNMFGGESKRDNLDDGHVLPEDEYGKGGFMVDENMEETDITLWDFMNSQFNYEKDYNPEIYEPSEVVASLPDDLLEMVMPDVVRGDESTYPLPPRWGQFVKDYSREYIESLESPLAFRSALQCKGLGMDSKEFKAEYEHWYDLAPYGCKVFLEYCDELGVLDYDSEIDKFEELLGKNERKK